MPKDVEWIRNGGRGLAKALAISLMLIFIFISPGISFELSDTSVTAGKNLIITGTSEPNSENDVSQQLYHESACELGEVQL